MHFRWVLTGLFSFAASTFVLAQEPEVLGSSPGALAQDASSQRASGTFKTRGLQQPPWAVRYGHEFWRDPRPELTSIPRRANDTRSPQAPAVQEAMERLGHAFQQSSNGPRMIARNYALSLDRSGFVFSPSFGTPQARGGQAAVHFRVSTREGELEASSDAQDSLEWSVMGNTAQTRLPESVGIIQHIEARAKGAYLTWVLPTRPAASKGNAAIELTVHMDGMSHAASTEKGEHFVDQNGIARMRFGKVTAVDSAGFKWNLHIDAVHEGLNIKIPAQILARASYPLAIDPEISPEQGIDIQEYVSTRLGSYNPAIASNGTLLLAVWESIENETKVYGARITSEGEILDPGGFLISTSPSRNYRPSVA
jgi:hypothetical protein